MSFISPSTVEIKSARWIFFLRRCTSSKQLLSFRPQPSYFRPYQPTEAEARMDEAPPLATNHGRLVQKRTHRISLLALCTSINLSFIPTPLNKEYTPMFRFYIDLKTNRFSAVSIDFILIVITVNDCSLKK